MIVLGLVVGSFLNVVIYRLPRETSIVSPASHCPACKRRLKPLDMIPVISYIVFKGRCRYCSAPIGWRYPAMEALTAVVFVAAFLVAGWSFLLVKYLFIGSLLLAVAFIDLEHYIIPDSLNIVLAAGGAVLTLLARDITLVDRKGV
ncbi:prepilin peptidase, partial [Desulforudis sp. 1190]|uniref:prepilin peptidase n=1 Tax=Desulforudis sp. 1190 TaxID=3416136 RepID=UPI003CE9474F